MQNNSDIWNGRSEIYAAYRPEAPDILLKILPQLAQVERPKLVVDLGCGTGLSTRLWQGHTGRIIGIEPNQEMIQQARQQSSLSDFPDLEYRQASADRTGLEDESVDIATCSQSFHWMEPVSTLQEIARILRPGGIFAAYDYDWPPTVNWVAERAFEQLMERYDTSVKQRDLPDQAEKIWSKAQHLERIKASGHFRFAREILVHHEEQGNADRFIGLTLSNNIGEYLGEEVSEEEVGLPEFVQTITDTLGKTPQPWYFSCRVRIGIK